MTTQTTIILVRHGETEWNVLNKLQGHKNSPLTLNGKRQAVYVKETLSSHKIDSAYTSPLKRAVDTAEIILNGRNIEAKKINNLKEIRLGPWEGKTKEATQQSHPEEHDNFWNKPHRFSLGGAESFLQLQQRLVLELKAIFNNECGKNVLVVTHWIAIKTILAYFTSTPLSQLSNMPDLNNGELMLLISNDNAIQVSRLQP